MAKTFAEMSERDLIRRLCDVTGMNYCNKDCDCGDNAELMFWPVGGEVPEWLPDWTNGTGYMEVYNWLLEASWTDARIRDAIAENGVPVK